MSNHNYFDDELIENVKKHSILYRSKQKKFHNLVYKENCWKEIAAKLNRTPEECKTKWRNIRDAYRKNKKKKNTGAAGYSKYDDERLTFLSESCDEGEYTDNISTNSKDGFEMHEEVPLSEPQYIFQDSNDAFGVQSNPITAIKSEPSDSLLSPDPLYSDQDVNRKKAFKRTRDGSKTSQDYPAGSSSTHKFFSSMADIVCKFPPDKIAEMRMRICNMVSETELGLLTDRSQSISAPFNCYESSSSP